jgi:hypothetical protein
MSESTEEEIKRKHDGDKVKQNGKKQKQKQKTITK